LATGGPWGDPKHEIDPARSPRGSFYAATNWDCCNGGQSMRGVAMPGAPPAPPPLVVPPVPPTCCFPWDTAAYGNHSQPERFNHPYQYSSINPRNCYYDRMTPAPPTPPSRGRAFPPSNMEALMRYGDTGSPAMSSDLFSLCPTSLPFPMPRRLLTTISWDS